MNVEEVGDARGIKDIICTHYSALELVTGWNLSKYY